MPGRMVEVLAISWVAESPFLDSRKMGSVRHVWRKLEEMAFLSMISGISAQPFLGIAGGCKFGH